MVEGLFKRGLPCRIEGCKDLTLNLGLCRHHYARLRDHGDPIVGHTRKGACKAWIKENASHQGDECLFWPFRKRGSRSVIQFRGRMASTSRVMCFEAHGEPPTPKHQAAHSCLNGANDCLNPRHLRWATAKENQADRILQGTDQRGAKGPGAKLTEESVRSIRLAYTGKNGRDLAKEYGVNQSTISGIVNRKTWKNLP